jgi:hypothetical protein
MDTVNSILDFLTRGGSASALILIVVSGAKKAWVFGWTYQDLQTDRDRWQQLALKNLKIAETTVTGRTE